MKSVKNILSAVMFSLSTATTVVAQPYAEKIDSLMTTAHERGFFNGNVLVARGGQVVYQNELGYADSTKTRLLQPDTRFNVGSISKEFDSVALMMLVEEGRLKLDDTVADYINGLPGWAEAVSMDSLLKYTSGLPRVEYDRSAPFTDADAMNFLRGLESLEFRPGSGYLYSNYNTFLRRKIIESISGQSFADFLQDRIFEPHGLRSGVVDPAPGTASLAIAFDHEFVADDFPQFMSGALYLTAQDLFKWTEKLHAHDIIGRESLLTLSEGYKAKRPVIGTVQVKDDELAMQWHAGSSYNFESSHYINSVDGFVVILMTNNKSFNVGDLTSSIDAILRNKPYEIPKKSLYLALRTEVFYHGFESGKKLLNDIIANERQLYELDVEKALAKTGGYLLGLGKLRDAINLLDYAAGKYPASEQFFLLLGDAYLQRGDELRARQNYEKARHLNPENEKILMRLQKL